MISALEEGKYSIDRKEDIITSCFFDYLFLLPDQMVWDIIHDSCNDKKDLPEIAGKIKKYEFWPKWDSSWTNNENFVEPDLFIRFEKIDIIIEAKREYNSQKSEQWEKEIISFINEYDKDVDKENLFLLAIDGNFDNLEKEKIILKKDKKSFYVFKTKWQMLYETILRLQASNEDINQRKILNMIIKYLEYFDILKITWPVEIKWQNNKITNFKNIMKIISKTGEEYEKYNRF